jgi:hypothetical protein
MSIFDRFLVPGQTDDAVDIVADHRGLGRHRRHAFKLLELLRGLFPGRLGIFLALMVASSSPISSRPFSFWPISLWIIPHLLAQVVILLGLAHPGLDLGVDVLLQFGELNFPVEDQSTFSIRSAQREVGLEDIAASPRS